MTIAMVTKMKVVKNKVRTCTEFFFLLICESLRIYLFIYLFLFYRSQYYPSNKYTKKYNATFINLNILFYATFHKFKFFFVYFVYATLFAIFY
jgi:hypothetical protein